MGREKSGCNRASKEKFGPEERNAAKADYEGGFIDCLSLRCGEP